MSEIDQLIQRYKQSGIIVDTNILLLYFIGAFDQNLIPKFKRTQQFVVEDHATLLRILGIFDKVITTPNILTEVGNLSGPLEHSVNRLNQGAVSASVEVWQAPGRGRKEGSSKWPERILKICGTE